MKRGLSRRQFLKLTSAGAVALAVPWALEACGSEEKVQFFTAHERATVEAATARLFPTDQDPGALEAKAVRYIENLLTAFDHDPPLIFAGGPFSGRQPFPHNETGQPSDSFPSNRFERFLPLSRVREIAWRVRLFGSANVPGGEFNDAVLGPTKGWRDLYREGIAALDAKSRELFGKDFIDLSPEDQDTSLMEADQEFVTKLLEHTLEGVYAPPEYGGNDGLIGWQSIKFEGDSQPLGYSIFNTTTNTYNEIPERPVSTANPDEDFTGFDDETAELIGGIATAIGGGRFF